MRADGNGKLGWFGEALPALGMGVPKAGAHLKHILQRHLDLAHVGAR